MILYYVIIQCKEKAHTIQFKGVLNLLQIHVKCVVRMFFPKVLKLQENLKTYIYIFLYVEKCYPFNQGLSHLCPGSVRLFYIEG